MLAALLSACAAPAPGRPDPSSADRADLELRMIDAIGALPALATIFDLLAAERARDGDERPHDDEVIGALRLFVERRKPELATAFGAAFETADLAAFVAFFESRSGRAFGRLHEDLVALSVRASAANADREGLSALRREAQERFLETVGPDERAAAEGFMQSSAGRTWAEGFAPALKRLLGRYAEVVQSLAEQAKRQRGLERAPPPAAAQEA